MTIEQLKILNINNLSPDYVGKKQIMIFKKKIHFQALNIKCIKINLNQLIQNQIFLFHFHSLSSNNLLVHPKGIVFFYYASIHKLQ